jgi:glycosyltransferase involved in cell wall biosynthesis
VLLVGNYGPDRQESMLRFARLLETELPRWDIQVERLQPTPVFGRIKRGYYGVGKWLGYLDKFVLFPSQLNRALRRRHVPSLVHICDHANAVYVRRLGNRPHLVTCHDLLAVRSARGEFPHQRVKASGRAYQRWITSGLSRAQRVACVSEATRQDLLRLTGLPSARVAVVPNGLNHPYEPLAPDALWRRWRMATKSWKSSGLQWPQDRFILHVGGNQWYKNRLGVLQVYARLRRRLESPPFLLMVGKPLTPALRESIDSHGLADSVVVVSDVTNQDLHTFYAAAELLFFPSIIEGFGWPILEALATGCRVVTTGLAPMTEVGGEAAAYTVATEAPDWEEQSVEVLASVLAEDAALRRLRVGQGWRQASRFTTDSMVEGYAEVYRQCWSETQRSTGWRLQPELAP